MAEPLADDGAEDEHDGEGPAAQQRRVAQQRAGGEPEGDDVVVYHGTLVGLQAIRAAGGGDAEATRAVAADTLAGLLRDVAAEMERVHGSDVVYQIGLLGDAGAAAEAELADAAAPLAAWKRQARRRLLDMSRRDTFDPTRAGDDPAPSPAPAPSGAAAKAFSAKATSYGVALLLIYITAAVLFAMVSMPFKQDTLLWGRPKAE